MYSFLIIVYMRELPSQTWTQNHCVVSMFGTDLSAIVIHNSSFPFLSLSSLQQLKV